MLYKLHEQQITFQTQHLHHLVKIKNYNILNRYYTYPRKHCLIVVKLCQQTH